MKFLPIDLTYHVARKDIWINLIHWGFLPAFIVISNNIEIIMIILVNKLKNSEEIFVKAKTVFPFFHFQIFKVFEMVLAVHIYFGYTVDEDV